MSTANGLRPGVPGYRAALVALVAAGLASYNALYATQSLLPALSEAFDASPATASLTVSAVTGMLALAIIPMSVLSERYGRGRVLVISALGATVLGVALAFAPSLEVLVAGRALQGVFVAGVPAVAMAWLSEEMHPDLQAGAMGRYVAGTTVGGLIGRLLPSGVLEVGSWRWGLGATAVVALGFAVLMALTLPGQRHFTPRRLTWRDEVAALAAQWRAPARAGIFVSAFLLMGMFVSVYNYVGYRLLSEFRVPESGLGLIFLLYLAGTWTSARSGAFVRAAGRRTVAVVGSLAAIGGVALTLAGSLPVVIAGVGVMTAGFFAVHSVASGWIGVLATSHRAEASATYLFCYYGGSSVLGYVSGHVFQVAGWDGLAVWLCGLVALALAVLALATRSEPTGDRWREPRANLA